jgi:hypothetical protein
MLLVVLVVLVVGRDHALDESRCNTDDNWTAIAVVSCVLLLEQMN